MACTIAGFQDRCLKPLGHASTARIVAGSRGFVRRKGRGRIDGQQALTWLQQEVSEFHGAVKPGHHENASQPNKRLMPVRERERMGAGMDGAGLGLPEPG
jgi:hypothetical protein